PRAALRVLNRGVARAAPKGRHPAQVGGPAGRAGEGPPAVGTGQLSPVAGHRGTSSLIDHGAVAKQPHAGAVLVFVFLGRLGGGAPGFGGAGRPSLAPSWGCRPLPL